MDDHFSVLDPMSVNTVVDHVDDFTIINVSLAIHAFEGLFLIDTGGAATEATDLAAENCVNLMNSSGIPLGCFEKISQHLDHRGRARFLDDQWLTSHTKQSHDMSASYSLLLRRYSAAYEHTSQDRRALLEQLRREIVVHLANGQCTSAQNCIDTFASIVQFSSKPASTSDFDNNAYCHFSFLNLVVAVYNYCLAPPPPPTDTMDMDDAIPGPAETALKAIESNFAKTQTYRSKNDRFFMPGTLELHYYRLMQLLHLLILFRTLKLREFSDEFTDLLLSQNPQTSNCQSILDARGASHLRTLLLVLFGITQVITRPFKDLSFRNYPGCDWLEDQFHLDAFSAEYALYATLLYPLSKGDNTRARAALQPNSQLHVLVTAYVSPFLPQDPGKSSPMAYWSYIEQIINYKSFLLVISFSKQISLDGVLGFMGYPSLIDPNEKSHILESLLRLISAMGLGNQGLRFNMCDQIFSLDEGCADVLRGQLRGSIDQLANQVRGNALAALVNGTLLEKYGF